jgi:Replication initiator protein A
MTLADAPRRFPDGRDEMNLADFPISALQRQQLSDADGRKLDRLEFEASRYDPATRQRVRQKVTLTASAREGLPTPADEHVILALLYVAKHGDNFATETVRFAPSQLFDIMGWAPNGRSYGRLRSVLRRLKALTIRYENAWWDAAGRAYEEELATGIVSGYRIARQVSGPRTTGTPLESWVTWSPQFHESLRKGNLKRLDLDVFFRLSTPTAQRMYRFLDKRFYTSPVVAMDLVEFACGHIGLTESNNVAILKRRLSPAITELEGIQFIARAEPPERYRKVKPGVWRIEFKPARAGADDKTEVERAFFPALTTNGNDKGLSAGTLAVEYYRLWDAEAPVTPGARDLEVAGELVKLHGAEATELVASLVQVTRRAWPECRSLSGAAQKYLADALKLHRGEMRRAAAREEAEARRRQEQAETVARQEDDRRQLSAWNELSMEEQEVIRQRVQANLGPMAVPEVFLRRLCLEEAARQQQNSDASASPQEMLAPAL